jgi:hypothetical protein
MNDVGSISTQKLFCSVNPFAVGAMSVVPCSFLDGVQLATPNTRQRGSLHGSR